MTTSFYSTNVSLFYFPRGLMRSRPDEAPAARTKRGVVREPDDRSCQEVWMDLKATGEVVVVAAPIVATKVVPDPGGAAASAS